MDENPEAEDLAGPSAETRSLPFPVVGVGASAGGLEAFTELLAALPQHPEMAFVLVQHLDPHHESQLTQILGRATALAVVEASDGVRLQSDHVYVIPPNADLAIADGALRLRPRETMAGRHLPIDEFLKSLAAEQKSLSIGVILSGTGADGALGVAEIKAAGGITFAQDDSARHDGMPRSAIAAGSIDFVLAPRQIARELTRLGQDSYFDGKPPAADEDSQEAYGRIIARVRAVTGVDFGHYRDTTIRRRILRRMALKSAASIEEYAQQVEDDPAEAAVLSDELLVNVTSFFREPAVFEALQQRVLPELLKARRESIRVWVSGCSTGQEAYSIAMALTECLDDQPIRPPIQIFATDISEKQSIEKARAGFYPRTIAAEVSPERLRRFFVEEEGGYRVSKAIRDVCIFARQNVGADPPFSRVDLISCRNLLIYFAPALQRRVLSVFHYALNPGGYLMLGVSETVGSCAQLFQLVDRKHKLYTRIDTASRPFIPYGTTAAHLPVPMLSLPQPGSAPMDPRRTAEALLAKRFAPPAVLVDDNLNILQFCGVTRPYLEPASGEASLNLLRMARGHLALDLGAVIREARTTGTTTRRVGIRLQEGNIARELAIEVSPVSLSANGPPGFLVSFEEGTPTRATPPEPTVTPAILDGADRDEAVRLLQSDLTAAQSYLQQIVEQHEAAQEELRSANEEVLSSNEELQSTNEELETAKEELQSANEELTTVNEELQTRNAELGQLNNDLGNLLASVRIPIVMLGRDLRIRRFNSSANRVLNLLDTDKGRPLSHLRLGLDAPGLEALLMQVLRDVVVAEVEAQDAGGRWYVLRLHPYRTADDRIDGIVMLAIDIDDLKRTQARIEETAEFSQAVIDTTRQPLVVLREDLRVEQANPAFLEAFRVTQTDTVGRLFTELGNRQWDLPRLHALLREVVPAQATIVDFQVEADFPGLGSRIMLLNAAPLRRKAGAPGKIVVAIEDVTDRRRATAAEQAAERLAEENRRKNEFLGMLSHELRNPLAPINNATQLIRLRGSDDADIDTATGIIERQVQQMKRLVDDLLDVSRIINGKIRLQKAPVELSTLVTRAVETTRPRIEARKQTLSVRMPDEPVRLEADTSRMVQVLANLLDNASKYTADGGRIEIAAEIVSGSQAQPVERELVIHVTDTGQGIAPQLLRRIFDLFFQGSRDLDRAPGGLGLGLTLVRDLVAMHGGTVEASSAGVGRGSEFTVHLPAPLLEAVPAPAPAGPARVAESAPRVVLVVDDHDGMRESMTMLLGQLGHDVRAAADGPTALAVARSHPPDVVLMDIGLPGMDGYVLAEKLRSLPATRDSVLIAVTGYGQAEARQRAKAAGFDAHLVKPVSLRALRAALASQRKEMG